MGISKHQRSLFRIVQQAAWDTVGTGSVIRSFHLHEDDFEDLTEALTDDMGMPHKKSGLSLHQATRSRINIFEDGHIAFGGICLYSDWGVQPGEGFAVLGNPQSWMLVKHLFTQEQRWVPEKVIKERGLSWAFQHADPDFSPC